MKHKTVRCALCALFVLAIAATAFAAPVAVVFSRENDIFLTDSGGEKPVKLAEGGNPEVSPNGRFVAFTAPAGKDGWGRMIAVIEIASKKRTDLGAIPGENSYGPRWSPDGKSILFNHWDEKNSEWVFGLATLADGKFRVLAPELQGVYSPFWSADGKHVHGQNLETFTTIEVESGKVVDQQPVAEITGDAIVSSAVRFTVSPDGSMWLFDGDTEDTSKWMKSGDGLLSAIFLHTPSDGKTRRLTTDTVCAMHPAWLPGGDSFLFAGYGPKEVKRTGSPFALFRMLVGGDTATLFLAEGGDPSASR